MAQPPFVPPGMPPPQAGHGPPHPSQGLPHAGPPNPGYYAYPYAAPVPNEPKAAVALVCGILGLFCFGILSGIPAIVLGILARRDIARSGGTLGGGALATTGIVVGGVASLMTVLSFSFALVPLLYGIGIGSKHPTPIPATVAPPPIIAVPPTATTAAPALAMPTTTLRGKLRIVELHLGGGSLERQLIAAQATARGAGRSILVEMAAPTASASNEFDAALADGRMQRALQTVDLVRVNVEEFFDELAALRMETDAVPYFYRVDASARPTDALSADEWDDNTASNMAPVLEAFVTGTLRERKQPSPLGTEL